MTKEELEKEATEYAQKLGVKDFIAKPKEIIAYFGYLAGAEPREKRITELEQKLEQTEKDLADYQFNYPTIKELQKENAELKELKKKKEEIEIMTNFCKACKKMHTDNLTKAKELLKDTLRYLDLTDCVNNDPRLILYESIEQFLSEVEK